MTDQPSYVCDLCGQQSDDLETIVKHLKEEHDVDDPSEVGSLDQDDGIVTLRHGDGTEVVVDLEEWLKDALRGD